jgi:hypothetical protein
VREIITASHPQIVALFTTKYERALPITRIVPLPLRGESQDEGDPLTIILSRGGERRLTDIYFHSNDDQEGTGETPVLPVWGVQLETSMRLHAPG